MAKVIFVKGQENIQGSMYAIATDSINLSSKNISSQNYKIENITDDQYNDLRLHKKNCYYDSNGVVWINLSPSFTNEAELQGCVDGLTKSKNSSNNSCIESLQTKSFDNYTYPLSKSLPEVAEDKGITWVAAFQLV